MGPTSLEVFLRERTNSGIAFARLRTFAQRYLHASGMVITGSLEAPIRHVSITADTARRTSRFALSAGVLSTTVVKVLLARGERPLPRE